MTPNERKKILDWMEKAKWAHPDGSMYVTTHDLTAFIESLSTEDGPLREGDWFEGTMDQLDEVFSITGHSISGSFGQRKALLFTNGYIVSFKEDDSVNKLEPTEFIIRARNTFNTPKL